MTIGAADISVAVPLIAAVLAAVLALGYNLVLKRREERRELRALVRLLEGELAALEAALAALIRKSERGADATQLAVSAWVAQQAHTGTVWDQTKLDLARHLAFDEWDLLRDVYVTIDVAWIEVAPPRTSEDDEMGEAFNDLRVAFIVESIGPRLLKVIPKALSVCHDHLDGSPPVKVPLAE